MPAIWSSSERPISVRTVWVDGIRHAILSPDDPLINRKSHRFHSHMSRNKSYTPEYQQLESRLDRLNSCFTNLQMVVNNKETRTSSQVYRKLPSPPCPRLSKSASDINAFQTFMMNRNIEKKQHCRRTVKDSDLFVDKRVFKNDTFERRTSESDFKCRQTEGIPDTFWNPLFERVLQWLDLSGRAQSCDFEDEFARRSLRDAEQKSSSAKKTLPRIKHDSFEERDWLIRQNCKLYKERSSDFKPEESKICEDRLPKIKNTKEQFQERNKTFVEPLPSTLNDTKAFLKLNEGKLKDEVREKAPLMMWSSPGRLKLHIVIPNIVCKENQTSKD